MEDKKTLDVDMPKIDVKQRREMMEKKRQSIIEKQEDKLSSMIDKIQLNAKFIEEFGEKPIFQDDIPNYYERILKKAGKIQESTFVFEKGIQKQDYSKLTPYENFVLKIGFEISKRQIVPIKMYCVTCSHGWYYKGQHWRNPKNVIVTCPRCGRKNKLSDGVSIEKEVPDTYWKDQYENVVKSYTEISRHTFIGPELKLNKEVLKEKKAGEV